MPPMPRDLQQQAHCWLPKLATIDVALVNRLAVWHIHFLRVTEKKRDRGEALQGHREVTRATKQAPFTPLELAAGSPSHRLPDLYSRNLNRPENLGDPTGIVSRPTTHREPLHPPSVRLTS